MPGPNQTLSKGFYVDAASNQFKLQKLVPGAKEHVTQAGAGELIVGVLQETVSAQDVTDGRIANIQMSGLARVISGAAASGVIAIGDRLVADASGCVKTAPAATAKQNQVGIALTASAATGDHLDIALTPGVQIDTA